MENTDEFVGQVFEMGTSLAITIPVNNVKFAGVKKKDWLRVRFNIERKEGD